MKEVLIVDAETGWTDELNRLLREDFGIDGQPTIVSGEEPFEPRSYITNGIAYTSFFNAVETSATDVILGCGIEDRIARASDLNKQGARYNQYVFSDKNDRSLDYLYRMMDERVINGFFIPRPDARKNRETLADIYFPKKDSPRFDRSIEGNFRSWCAECGSRFKDEALKVMSFVEKLNNDGFHKEQNSFSYFHKKCYGANRAS